MAISALDYLVFRSLRAKNVMAPTARAMEFGESNWYGDVPLNQLINDIRQFVPEPERQAKLIEDVHKGAALPKAPALYAIAKVFFQVFLGEYVCTDPLTPGSNYQFDLNLPISLQEQFDATINIGTAEHVFNVYQFYKTMHERTRPGGLMIHSAPCTGWPDHGFYNFHPTFFFDLARTNNYEFLMCLWGKINPLEYRQIQAHEEFVTLLNEEKFGPSTLINVVFRKSATEAEFQTPIQGYYAGTLSPEQKKAWHAR